jgi:outer membrane protein
MSNQPMKFIVQTLARMFHGTPKSTTDCVSGEAPIPRSGQFRQPGRGGDAAPTRTGQLCRLGTVAALLLAATARAEETNRPVRSLTLPECIERALASNLDLKLQRLNPSIADWGVVQAQGVFDPSLVLGANYRDTTTPISTNSPLTTLETRQLALSAAVTGKLATGTGYSLSGTGEHITPAFLPYSGGPTLTLSQPLLKNFGLDPNLAVIRVARKLRGIAGQQFLQQVINTISAVNNAYYELVYAIENHKATVEDLDRAKQLLAEDRKRVEIGTMSPLDVVQAEAGVALGVQSVIISERVVRDNENALKRLITQDVLAWQDQALAPASVLKFEMVDPSVTNHIRIALEKRPDFVAAREELERRNILVKFNRNQLLPEIDLQGSYGLSGLGETTGRFSDSIADAQYPAWGVGVTVTFPLGNRQARAKYHIARLQSDQQIIALKGLEQDIIVAVDNAVRLVQSNLKSVEATEAARRYAVESLKAEETKLRAGSSTTFLVLQAQSQLAAAISAEIRARADYAKSLVALAQVEGTTLERHNIKLDEGR